MVEAEECELCSSLDVEARKILNARNFKYELVPSVGVEPTLGGF